MDDGRPALERFIVENRNLATGIAGGALLIGLILGALIASSVLAQANGERVPPVDDACPTGSTPYDSDDDGALDCPAPPTSNFLVAGFVAMTLFGVVGFISIRRIPIAQTAMMETVAAVAQEVVKKQLGLEDEDVEAVVTESEEDLESETRIMELPEPEPETRTRTGA